MLHQRPVSYPSLQLSQRWRFGASQWSASSSSPSSPMRPSWFRCLLLFSEEDFFITFPTSWWSVGKKGVGRWNLGCFWLFSFSRPFFLSFMLFLKYISKNGLRTHLDVWIMGSLAKYGRVGIILYSNSWPWVDCLIFIGPRSDHSLPMSVTDWLTH